MGIKYYTCHDEHWVMHRIIESLYCTPETNITLYANYPEILKKLFLKVKKIFIKRNMMSEFLFAS